MTRNEQLADDRVRAADARRAQRIRAGQARVDVPVDCLRVLLAGSAAGRRALAAALGPRSVAALADAG